MWQIYTPTADLIFVFHVFRHEKIRISRIGRLHSLYETMVECIKNYSNLLSKCVIMLLTANESTVSREFHNNSFLNLKRSRTFQNKTNVKGGGYGVGEDKVGAFFGTEIVNGTDGTGNRKFLLFINSKESCIIHPVVVLFYYWLLLLRI